MRSKTLLLTAALAAAGAASAMAQNVYSVNAVGYVNSTIRGINGTSSSTVGYGMYANPFSASVAIGTLIPDGSSPSDLHCLNFLDNGASQSFNYSVSDGIWDDGSVLLNIGKGVLIQNLGVDFNVTWVGEVLQSVGTAPLQNPIAQGTFLYGSKIPQQATLANLGLAAPEHDLTVLRYLSDTEGGGGSQTLNYLFNDGIWDAEPEVKIAEGYFISSPQGAVTWNKEFHVN